MQKRLLPPLLLLALAASSPAGTGLDPSRFDLTGPTGGGWLKPEFSGSASFGFVSGGGVSYGTGTMSGTMTFDLHPRLTAEVDMGYGRIIGLDAPVDGFVMGGLGLEWRPTDDLTLELHYGGVLPDTVFGGF